MNAILRAQRGGGGGGGALIGNGVLPVIIIK